MATHDAIVNELFFAMCCLTYFVSIPLRTMALRASYISKHTLHTKIAGSTLVNERICSISRAVAAAAGVAYALRRSALSPAKSD